MSCDPKQSLLFPKIYPPSEAAATNALTQDRTKSATVPALSAATQGTAGIKPVDHEQTSIAPGNASVEVEARRPDLTVLFDGACPLCRREISVYQGLKPMQGSGAVSFSDVSDHTISLPPGAIREQLLARFHVLSRDGELLSGALAFIALWAALPGWRWLATIGRVPGAAWLMERTYGLFLRCRPTMQRWALRLEKTALKKPL
jgi:predicted DCC family thiol-disulfide oxidoreductase YuxK